jgi:hypothetical protein
LTLVGGPELGEVAPPPLSMLHLIAAAVAAGIDDEGLGFVRLITAEEPGAIATRNAFTADDSRRRPGESVEKQLLAHPLLSTLALRCLSF